MALTTIQQGAVAKSSVLNDNFNYLEEQISKQAIMLDAKVNSVVNNSNTVTSSLATTNKAVSTLNTDVANLKTSVSGKASKNLSDANPTTNFYITTISKLAPNYSAGIAIGDGYVTAKAGWCYALGRQDNGSSYITIGGEKIEVSYDSGDGQSYGSLFLMVDKGTTINGFENLRLVKFYPCKGV